MITEMIGELSSMIGRAEPGRGRGLRDDGDSHHRGAAG